ncbi:MAG TPA: DUF3795 domain-containing protein [Spirochaetia bacterium]|nr:DUF3795 domain-containing protein [Spirochaetia bacterium]
MIPEKSNPSHPQKEFAAVCGLFCPSCTCFIGSTEDRPRLRRLAERLGRTMEEMECHGCRSTKKGLYCEKYCAMAKCASMKGIDFCGDCPEFPCIELKAFQSQMPHRLELWESHARIKESGYETWYSEMVEHYSCRECGTINSAYDLSCRTCHASPSCGYVEQHRDQVMKAMDKMAP